MKKRILILSIAILALMLCITACAKPTVDPLTATAIEVVSGSVVTECNVGDTLDFSGIKVKVTYSDSTTVEIGYSDVQISAVDTAAAGEKTVTVTYGELSTTFKVTVKEAEKPAATLSSIKIVAGTVPSALYIGQSFDASGLQVEAIYSDGTKQILTSGMVTYTTVDASTAGDKTFTVTYQGMTDSITVKVYDITSIKVISGTIANKLFVGETLDTSTIQAQVTYGDGTSKIVSASELTVGSLDTTTYGNKQVDVTYNGITVKHDVEVVGEVSITVLAGSVPTSVKVGATYDASQIKATLTYSGNSTDPKELTAEDLTVSVLDTTTAGDKTLKVTYGALETTVNVKVVGVESLTVITNSVASEILKGAALDTSKISVSVKYTDGTTDVVGAAALTLGTIDTTKAGEQKLTITHLDKTVEYTVKVCEVTSIRVSGVANSVQSGKPVDISGMKVYGVYNDSKNTIVELTEGVTTNVTELNTTYINSTEARTLTVSYSGAYGEFTTSLTIYATAPELTGIEIRNYNTEVLLGNAYDKTSVVVYATYGNGTSARVTAFTMTDVATNVAGDVTFTVTYEGKTATKTVKVCEITTLDIVGAPLFVPSGELIDLTGMQVFGVYNDTAKTRVPFTDGTITTNVAELNTTYLDSTEPRVLSVSYVGMYGQFSTTYTIDTTAPVLEELVIQSHTAEVKLGTAYGKSDVTVVAVYGNGVRVTLTANDFAMTPVSTAVGGNVTFTVSYTDTINNVTETAQATVKVCTITRLEIDDVADKVQSGNAVSIDGMTVYGVYNDSAESREKLTSGYTTNIDALNADINGTTNRVLVVTYENGAQGTFEISVTAPALVGIEIVGWDTSIGLGGTYDNTTVRVEGIYGNGTRSPIEGFTVSGVSTGTVGQADLTVTYQGLTSPAVKVNVVGIAGIQVSGIPTLVNKGDALNTDGVQITVTFTDGSTRVVGKSDVQISAADTTTGGDKTLTVSYFGTSTVFSYHVKAATQIEIYSGLTYIIRTGHTVDFSALKILVTYTNGDKEVKARESLGYLIDCTIEGNRVTITYEGCVATRDLVEAKLDQIHALNGTIPGSILAGNQLNYSDFRITFVYRWKVPKIGDDGQPVVDPETGETIMVVKEELVLVDLNEPGLYTLQFTEYKGHTPTGILYGLNPNVDTSTAGDRVFQVLYLPTGAELNEMGIPLYQAQAKIIVIDVESISVVPGSVPSSVKLNGEYDISKIAVQVTYTDGTYKYVDISELKSVSALNTSSAGTQTLTVTYQGPTAEHTATYNVNVVDTGASIDGVIFGAMLPDSLIARDTYKGNFRPNEDGKYNMYVVGDDNPYILYLNVAVLDANNKLVDVNGKDVATTVKVYEITNGANTLLEGEALTAVVSFNGAKNSYQFTPAAVGRCFRLEISPASNYVGSPVKHEIKVVDGYNIYDEKELNLLTNTYGDWTCEDLNENISSLGRLDQGEVAERFLRQYFLEKLAKETGRTVEEISPEEAEAAFVYPKSINAVILHGNMTIEVEDLPPEYFHTYTKDGVTKTELIDHLEVYHRLVPTDQPFYFYGNYYSVFSYNLPCVVPKSVWNNVDEYSNSSLFCFRFDIRDYWALAYRTDYDQIEYPDSKQIAYVIDAGFRDNDPNSNDQSASERHMRGLTCFTNKAVTTNFTNVNVEAFVVALRPEGTNCTVNLNKVRFYNCWQGQIFAWNDNGFQLDNWPTLGGNVQEMHTLPGRFGAQIHITDSVLAKCGGPVILAQSYRAKEAVNNDISTDVFVDDKSVLYSYVTGQEAWFVAVNQTPMAAQIVALDALVKGTAAPQGVNASYLSDKKIQGVNTMNMVMVVMGAGIVEGEEYSGSFTKGGEVKMQMVKNASSVQPAPQTLPWYYDMYMSVPAISKAPIFTTSAGGHFFANPYESPEMPQGSFSVDFANGGAMNYASGNCFQGDYITMHMYGMGIMLEYYNATNSD